MYHCYYCGKDCSCKITIDFMLRFSSRNSTENGLSHILYCSCTIHCVEAVQGSLLLRQVTLLQPPDDPEGNSAKNHGKNNKGNDDVDNQTSKEPFRKIRLFWKSLNLILYFYLNAMVIRTESPNAVIPIWANSFLATWKSLASSSPKFSIPLPENNEEVPDVSCFGTHLWSKGNGSLKQNHVWNLNEFSSQYE